MEQSGRQFLLRCAFGDFVLDSAEAALTCRGESVPIAPKEFELLRALVSRAGHLVQKEELIRQVWPDTFVSDSSLLRNISVLRRHLGYDAIRTVPKRGYAFALPVVTLESSVAAITDSLGPEREVAIASQPAHRDTKLVQQPNSAETASQCSIRASDDVIDAHLQESHSSPVQEQSVWLTRHMAILAVVILFAATAMFPGLPRPRIGHDSIREASLSTAIVPQENPESARLCKIAWFYRNKATGGDLEKAIAFFRKATKVAPNDSRAWAGLTDALVAEVQTAELDQERSAAMDSAKLAAQKAVIFGASLPEAHMAAGVVDWQAGDTAEAEKEFKKALALNPQSGEAQYVYASMLSETGRLSEAKAPYDRALQLEPSSVRVVANAATLYARLGLFDQGLQLLHRAIDMNRESVLVYGDLGQVLTRMHKYREAAMAFHRARVLTGTFQSETYNAQEAYCLAQLGKKEQARATVRMLNMRRERQGAEALAIAILYSGLNDNKEAEAALRQAIAAGEITPIVAADQPYFESLRKDAAFAQLTAATADQRKQSLTVEEPPADAKVSGNGPN